MKLLAKLSVLVLSLAGAAIVTAADSDIRSFLKAWGDAWSPRHDAPSFTAESFSRFYVDGDRLLAYDNTEAGMPTVIRGKNMHSALWGPWVAQFAFWAFTPDIGSARVYGDGKVRTVSLFVDVHGEYPNGEILQGRQHVTIVIERAPEGWQIVHESIWGPVREFDSADNPTA